MLLGALGLFDAAPAEAQTTVCSGTLTVADKSTTFAGCDNTKSGAECSSASLLTDDDFTVGSTTWSITQLLSHKTQGSLWVGFVHRFAQQIEPRIRGMRFQPAAQVRAGHQPGLTPSQSLDLGPGLVQPPEPRDLLVPHLRRDATGR